MTNRTMLLAAIFSILAGILFVALPGTREPSWRLFLGALWLCTGTLWFVAWRRSGRGPAA